ncbi:MAG: AAA domain-containing protein, partial [Gammaproteobacteria bacterium]|nr:AAA domain-containing protein [candidate division Zixibacteria bacterium]NIR94892.1 AAA domain-containing protein [Gammaproteobacteria bacterium]NIT59526.1 AAA domain-containing protein [Fodinibius sp.]NIS47530.1 AAA domain-containing protein [candidate division Zixibacteria bacterium]NIU15627.1 AAA domain-containing protein [candidate division Zixibacteria bacterium]
APSASHLAPDIVGNSMQLQNQLHYARTIAGFNEPVLITGDTGTGKDLIAKYIHYHSNRQSHPLHIVNCGAINPELFESEFFGHVKGAYTGATGDHAGHFAKANQGTLVLDEVTEMDLKFQVKLLRAIENQEVYPVGSQKMIRLNTRIIALTNRNIREQIQQGRFREDLYYRLNRYHLHLTPLCERPRDIQPLGEYYIGKSWFSTVNEWRSQIDPQVYELLKQMKLPGNVRDLQNLILKVISYKRPSEPFLSCADFERVIDQSDLIASPSSLPVDQLNTYLTNAERTRILETLSTNDFNISNAAKQLGVSRQNLQHRMKRLNIRNPVHG